MTGDAIVGISDHGGWAVLVTVAGDGTLLDRRKVALVDENLPHLPHHVEGQALPVDQAVALVEWVRASAERHADEALEGLALALPGRITGVALRACPPLPATVAERLADYRSRNVADWVMYRQALAKAAEARGWAIHWYDSKDVLLQTGEAVDLRKSIGAPWSKDHRTAMAAALVSRGSGRPRPRP